MKAFCVIILFIVAGLNRAQCQLEFRVSINLTEESELQERPNENLISKLCDLLKTYNEMDNTGFCNKLTKEVKKGNTENVDVFSSSDYWEVDNFKKYIRENNFSTAWINAYYKNKKIDLKDALTGNIGTTKHNEKVHEHLSKQNRVFKETGVVFRISLNVTTELENYSDNESGFSEDLCETLMTYSSTYISFDKKSCNKLRRDMKNLDDNGFIVIRQGYQDFWEIDSLKKYLRKEGFQTAFIVAFNDGERTQIKDVLMKID